MDQLEFERLYRAHVSQIFAYCVRRIPPAEAHDATSEVFVVAWRRFRDIPDASGALPWLFGVARNVVRDRLRADRRQKRVAMKLAAQPIRLADGPEPQVVRSAEREAVRAAIAKLPERDGEILMLVEWDGLSRNSVAEVMGVSRSAIDKRIARAYSKLARHLSGPLERPVIPSRTAVEQAGEV